MEEKEQVLLSNFSSPWESYFNNKNCINLQFQLAYQLSHTYPIHPETKNKLREERGICLLFILKPYTFSENSMNLNDTNKQKRPLG